VFVLSSGGAAFNNTINYTGSPREGLQADSPQQALRHEAACEDYERKARPAGARPNYYAELLKITLSYYFRQGYRGFK